jgi:hypothetical protein
MLLALKEEVNAKVSSSLFELVLAQPWPKRKRAVQRQDGGYGIK